MGRAARPKHARGKQKSSFGAIAGGVVCALATAAIMYAALPYTKGAVAVEPAMARPSLHSLSATTMAGEALPLSSMAGKVTVAVNVASRWGSTDAVYTQLTKWHKEFGSKLEILLFPTDAFRQELPSEEIPAFVKSQGLPTDGGGCHLMAKVDVNGPHEDPVFSFAKTVFPGEIGWNFDGLFIFDAAGQPVGRFHRGSLFVADSTLRALLA